jgi:hypothetical protein
MLFGRSHRAAYAIKRIMVAAKSAVATSAVASCVRVIGSPNRYSGLLEKADEA